MNRFDEVYKFEMDSQYLAKVIFNMHIRISVVRASAAEACRLLS